MAKEKKTAGKTAQTNVNENGAKFAAVFNNAKTAKDGQKILDYMINGFKAAFEAKFGKVENEPAKTKPAPAPKTDAKAEKKTEKKAEVAQVKEGDKKALKKLSLEFHDYSEKSFAVTGDTKAVKDICEKYKGRFNRYLSVGAGWIFSKRYEDEVKAALAL